MYINIVAQQVKSGMTNKEVADLLGLSEAGYVLKKTGKNDFTASEIKKLAEHYQVSAEYLIDEGGE